MFDVVHGKRKSRDLFLNVVSVEIFDWANFGTAIYEYRQGDLHGKEVLFIEG